MQERVAAVLHGCPDNQKDTLRKSHKIRPSMKRKIIQRRHWSCKIRHNQNRLLGELSYQKSQNTDVISRLMPVQWIESQTGKEGLLNCDILEGTFWQARVQVPSPSSKSIRKGKEKFGEQGFVEHVQGEHYQRTVLRVFVIVSGPELVTLSHPQYIEV